MKRAWFISGLVAACAGALLVHWNSASRAQQATAVQWIWFNEDDPTQEAPAETRYFRRVFVIDRPVQKVVDEGTAYFRLRAGEEGQIRLYETLKRVFVQTNLKKE